ncbi:methyl-accepting chemotaxis protein [Moritella sp. Urea-trap-13]|uniref:methyl-accepting chemotaxis protein n=1 Tax=Moritella sp. Urea-trap-13 TaxID=2058327 RepID=UPI000C343570|nr:methyl-accepting chemotaxis protein [Moritella sp. Urea-trap-13]PKH09041.1 chemotaxis protein [Moritella sp. Urea-trap-13]
MNNLKMKNKLLLIAILPMVIALSVALTIIVNLQTDAVENTIKDHHDLLLSERQKQLSDAVNIARKVVKSELDNEQNKMKALDNIRAMLKTVRFSENNSGYFFIYDNEGYNIVHSTSESEQGKNRLALQDPNGVKIIQELIKAGQSGGDFFNYVYAKPGSASPQPKLSYAAPVEGTNWFIGTGVYIDDIERATTAYSDSAWRQMRVQIQSVITSSAILALLTIVIMLWVARRVSQPINVMVDTLRDIADGEGDLTRRLDITGKDEIAQLGEAFNRFVSKLHSIITDVSSATHQISNAASSLNLQTQQTAEQLTIHNNETDQIVTAVTEMSATANDVAQNVTQVADATHAATQDSQIAQDKVATSTGAITALVDEVEQAGSHMTSLHEQSQKIDGVLQVIGSIAEQTNLLALNAAIEAARAGEQGRGFAVVADEVRSLASRTQDSTLEIKEMLDGLHQLVAQAVAAMNTSQDTSIRAAQSSAEISDSLSAVTNAVDAINDMTNQIATAATEQSSVTEEINRNMVTIRDVVTNLLESSHESAQVSEDLSAAGCQLESLLSQFKL